MPGYFLQGSGCAPCNAKGFNQTIHAYTTGCVYACVPGLFFRGLNNQNLACNQKCTKLQDGAATGLWPSCSNYYIFHANNGTKSFLIPPIQWPIYLLGVCGSNATDPASDLAVVRNIGMYAFQVFSATGLQLCGNFMLNAGSIICCLCWG